MIWRWTNLIFAAAFGVFMAEVAQAHPGHVEADASTAGTQLAAGAHSAASAVVPQVIVAAPDASKVSGQGDLKFRVLYTKDHLPDEAIAVLVKAHGGFAVDRRPGKGETYFALPGAGIIRLSADLKRTRLVPTPAEPRDTTLHNTTIWYGKGGIPYLSFPSPDASKIYTTTLDGTLRETLGAPSAEMKFGDPKVNDYFKEGGRFVPTDTEYYRETLFVTTGYSPLDFVLTAKLNSFQGVSMEWQEKVFGGKGDGAGEFGTGHGITIPPGEERIVVADRPNSQLERFTLAGEYVDTIELPKGSFPCDTDYAEGLLVVGCLHGPDREKGAPIYILKDDKVVSTIMPKEELGLENFQHIHNAVMRRVGAKLYIIAQAWNPGDFAILEQVMD